MTHQLLFFVADPRTPPRSDSEPNVEFEFWTPSRRALKPPGSTNWPFTVWTALHAAHIFCTRDYGVLMIRENHEVVHRSCVFPKYYRFPFMAHGDLQVGDVWTAPARRRMGLARMALAEVLRRFPHRRIWYITEESNPASTAVARKAGMRLYGFGNRTRPAGIGAVGQFQLLERIGDRPNVAR